MGIDLQAAATEVRELPSVLSAAGQARVLLRYGLACAALVAVLLASATFAGLFAATTLWPTVLCNLAASFLLAGAAVQAAREPARWRAALLATVPAKAEVAAEATGWYERTLDRISRGLLGSARRLGLASLWLLGWSLLAMLCIRLPWDLAIPGGQAGMAGNIAVALSLLLAFGLLVAERHLTQANLAQWPEARALALILRVALAELLINALCLLFYSPDNLWPARVATLSGLLPAAVALELAVRAVLSWFSPRRPSLEPPMLADSFVAGLLRWPPRPLQALQQELKGRFGIDLRQIWAFNYMRRAALPVFTVVALLGWALSGVRQVPLDGRGVYEQFGNPLRVLGPGLHVGLPWPLGRVIPVENGTVHELATGLEGAAAPSAATADGPAPVSADRLWDATHARDNTQVIASSSGAQQNFQVVNMDVRFIYRIGLSDADALAATYHSADVPQLIRDTASRVLVHSLASSTLDGLLGEDRQGLSQRIGEAVQADLHKLGSGVEVLATVVEAIHPPAGAANAYHAVQAAQISAQALVARERGAAAEQMSQAQLVAFDVSTQAEASARENHAAAQAADRTFEAERQAYASAGQAFIFERYLAQLSLGLAQGKLLILDHRLGGGSAPTLDLRTFFAPVDATPPRAVR
ncbi:protease modulator HflK [Pseudomonas sp. KNUC1026]|uniref:protease modulator HflK n=1 Tax=Pseudomonas sp. KNUC1026 TaxID=2893890 RepID=UPI001F229B6F|nr:protease modulator HflK [Pseudomonas sp. KNUC1026]UFH49277.1 protease modulator HflK [Pseudomonas sp. KNUC1026]